ncbi:MAG TPA: hypothetical protein VGG39_31065 [Polyangiaceae bacterium]|jgi:hypothetical protein
MATFERAARQVAESSHPAAHERHTSALLEPLAAGEGSEEAPTSTEPPAPPASDPVLHSLPTLREDERFARSSESGVVVIVRRRPAAA